MYFSRIPEGVKGYRVWSVEPGNHQRFFISRDVVFEEDKVYRDTLIS